MPWRYDRGVARSADKCLSRTGMIPVWFVRRYAGVGAGSSLSIHQRLALLIRIGDSLLETMVL
jgi:hypothetical protein